MNFKATELFMAFIDGAEINYQCLDSETRKRFDALCCLHNAIIGLDKHYVGFTAKGVYDASLWATRMHVFIPPYLNEKILAVLTSKRKPGRSIDPTVAVNRARNSGIIVGWLKGGGESIFGDISSCSDNIYGFVNSLFYIGGSDARSGFKQMIKSEKLTFDHCRNISENWMRGAVATCGVTPLSPPTLAAAERWDLSMCGLPGYPDFRTLTRQTLSDLQKLFESQ